MVAYNFAPRFAELVASGAKTQTIRAPRKRHVCVGGPLQLRTGMGTKAARKLIDPDPICTSRDAVTIDPRGGVFIRGEGVLSLDYFALRDGFKDWPDMRDWWRETYGDDAFKGVLIRWEVHAWSSNFYDVPFGSFFMARFIDDSGEDLYRRDEKGRFFFVDKDGEEAGDDADWFLDAGYWDWRVVR